MTRERFYKHARNPRAVYLTIGLGHFVIAWADQSGWISAAIVIEIALALAYLWLTAIHKHHFNDDGTVSDSMTTLIVCNELVARMDQAQQGVFLKAGFEIIQTRGK